MAISTRILKDAQLFVAALSGRVTMSDVIETIQRNAREPDFNPGMDRLIFLQYGLDLSDANFSTVLAVKDEVVANSFGGSLPDTDGAPLFRVALLAPPTPNEGIMKLFRAIMELEDAIIYVRCFRDLPEALAWLGHEDPAPETFQEELEGL
ncbi:hypothetical protein [Pelagibius marinus]|uniref:hypothetical protein n=1 Tax=Pelagibius marinus TaxID=2762760 RepID=UPI00187291E0|nr:hypothetical protein [Pelagibius marinus]